MPVQPSYQLLDFGAGRELERFGSLRLDRPAPAAIGHPRRHPELWSEADARYKRTDAGRGQWQGRHPRDATWQIECGALKLELKLSDSGHVGLFPEQLDNWAWIDRAVRGAGRPLNVLNLFAHTGGSTLAAAAAGAHVTHVDAAANLLAWARRNAAASSLAEAPIRWIAEDALKFARRELRRGRKYDALILDPPAYGHGPRGETWQLDEHLPELLAVCWELMQGRPEFVLLTCHSGQLAEPAVLKSALLRGAAALAQGGRLSAGTMEVVAIDGRRLNAGARVRWSSHATAIRPVVPTASTGGA